VRSSRRRMSRAQATPAAPSARGPRARAPDGDHRGAERQRLQHAVPRVKPPSTTMAAAPATSHRCSVDEPWVWSSCGHVIRDQTMSTPPRGAPGIARGHDALDADGSASSFLSRRRRPRSDAPGSCRRAARLAPSTWRRAAEAIVDVALPPAVDLHVHREHDDCSRRLHAREEVGRHAVACGRAEHLRPRSALATSSTTSPRAREELRCRQRPPRAISRSPSGWRG